MKTINFFLAVGIAFLLASLVSSTIGLIKISSLMINFITYAVSALALILIGFFLSEKETLSSGFLGGGVMLLLLSSLLSSLASITSGISGLLGGLSKNTSAEIIPYLNILFLIIALVLFIIMAVKIDKEK
jgi:hypothetical protein